nr:indole-3-glycerol phosphate synthase TrpC [Leptospirillum ferrooxidans]
MPNPVLTQILESKQEEISHLSEASLKTGVSSGRNVPLVRDFLAGWRQERGSGVRVIAESKSKSPSRGIIRMDYDPVAIALEYAESGASGISVLTDPRFFGGSLPDLLAVKSAFLSRGIVLPVLRKDFIIDPRQVDEAFLFGADMILLIVRILADKTLVKLIEQARELGMEALVEVHSETEMKRALDAGCSFLGVNHRDLDTLQMDLDLSSRLAGMIPDHVIRIAESGLKTGRDCLRMAELGYDGVLVGESFLTTAHPGLALKDFLTYVD